MKLVVINQKLKSKTIFRDSLNLVNTSLENALNSFGCDINKGILPYEFYNKSTLHYKGKLPNWNFYKKLSIYEYSNLLSNTKVFDAKLECLSYLKKDVLGLIELIDKISGYFYNKFNYNITDRSTIPGVGNDNWGQKEYNQEMDLKL
ncbi:DNA polymerase (mitochondrion) [Armillaria borealis]|uniref:Probable DNA polymerase n=1 Tax=Armillaria borealis TaxID=47425 RepID=A0A4D6FHB5_9AGAR|nr:DNA polymerase [Armillaria borealis]QCB16412.1 DNA polymerase [Armillaria borealis]